MQSLYIFEIPYKDPIAYFSKYAQNPYSFLFDSNDSKHPNSRYSYILINPDNILNKNDLSIFENLNCDLKTVEDLPPFQGGWAGYFGYDLGFDLEPSIQKSNSDTILPKAAFGLYSKVVSFDHALKKAYVICQNTSEMQAHAFKEDVLKIPPLPLEQNDYTPEWQSNFSRTEYESAVQKIIDYIHEGDIFQANMSQQFRADLPAGFSSFAHYCHLREVSPAPYSAYLNFGGFVISSSSPELFLRVEDNAVTTMPIKGTARSHEDKATLENSSKDRAENVMIVDLLRNDIAKSCTPESVEVPKLCQLETFSHVHHLVSTVTGKLKSGTNATELLKNAFPGGSITGAPKMRAMEIIEELEPLARGPYCGSLALIGSDNQLESSIAIRTLIFEKDHVRFNVGGGIVADSNPAQEYDETLAKAEGIFESFKSSKPREAAS